MSNLPIPTVINAEIKEEKIGKDNFTVIELEYDDNRKVFSPPSRTVDEAFLKLLHYDLKKKAIGNNIKPLKLDYNPALNYFLGSAVLGFTNRFEKPENEKQGKVILTESFHLDESLNGDKYMHFLLENTTGKAVFLRKKGI